MSGLHTLALLALLSSAPVLAAGTPAPDGGGTGERRGPTRVQAARDGGAQGPGEGLVPLDGPAQGPAVQQERGEQAGTGGGGTQVAAGQLGAGAVGTTLQPQRNWLVPAVEAPLINLTVMAFNAFVMQAEWARVTPQSIAFNARSAWVIDSDDAWVNFLAHPYHGSLAFNAARSSGLTFYESLVFPFVKSYLWEVGAETQLPSANDYVMTTASGVVMGEAFHRATQLLLDGPQAPGFLGQLFAAALSPLGSVNRHLFGRPVARAGLAEPPPHEVRWLLGASAFAPTRELRGADGAGGVAASSDPRVQPYAGVELTYGFPGQPGATLRAPFDHFHVRAAMGLPGRLTGDLFVRGLVAGWRLPEGRPVAGAWGLFASHDFSSGPDFRVATTALGPGLALQAQLPAGARLRATGVLAASLLGGAGSVRETDVVDTGLYEHPLYSVGPGAQGLLDVELSHGAVGALALTGRAYQLRGLTPGRRGWERLGTLGLRGLVNLAPGQQLGGELLLGTRASEAGPGALQQGALGRLFWVLALERLPQAVPPAGDAPPAGP
jgi:hypothetical protein